MLLLREISYFFKFSLICLTMGPGDLPKIIYLCYKKLYIKLINMPILVSVIGSIFFRFTLFGVLWLNPAPVVLTLVPRISSSFPIIKEHFQFLLTSWIWVVIIMLMLLACFIRLVANSWSDSAVKWGLLVEPCTSYCRSASKFWQLTSVKVLLPK